MRRLRVDRGMESVHGHVVECVLEGTKVILPREETKDLWHYADSNRFPCPYLPQFHNYHRLNLHQKTKI